mgnify:FL=1
MIDIYYVEEDEDISHAVREFLARDGYRVWVFPTLSEIKQALCCMLPSLVLVDWNMPEDDGRFLCQWIRQTWSELPVIFITVRGDPRDGYIVKPFALDVLMTRIRALLRGRETVQQRLTCGALVLDRRRRQVLCGAETVSLSPSEYQLLLYLLQNKGRTVTREKLLEKIWDANGNAVNDNTLTVTMKRLREKLHQPVCLKTVRGVGYRMEETD